MGNKLSKLSYVYSPLSRGQIRLLSVTCDHEDLQCALKHFELDNAPEYIALSYCWDGQSPDQQLNCDGLPLKVTANVKAVLHYILEAEPNTYVWIDGVCINQHDTDEKNLQVPQMGHIYTAATKCIAWI